MLNYEKNINTRKNGAFLERGGDYNFSLKAAITFNYFEMMLMMKIMISLICICPQLVNISQYKRSVTVYVFLPFTNDKTEAWESYSELVLPPSLLTESAVND